MRRLAHDLEAAKNCSTELASRHLQKPMRRTCAFQLIQVRQP
jgi:hypothetical protein